MPKQGKRVAGFANEVAWVTRLPDGGGQWGMELISTASAIELELTKLNAARAVLDTDIKKRKKFLAGCTRRATKEALMLFSESAIEKAKELAAQAPVSPN